MGAEPSRPGDYTEPVLPKGELEVRLSVYTFDFSGISLFNSIGSGITGAYHSGLVVLGNEYSFGAHDSFGETGIYVCKPEMNPDYQFYDRVVMGRLRGSQEQVLNIIRDHMEMDEWHGKQYSLLENNCNHFASDLCWALLRRRPPDWINNTAEKMARNTRTTHILNQAFRLAVASYRGRYGGRPDWSERTCIAIGKLFALALRNIPDPPPLGALPKPTFGQVSPTMPPTYTMMPTIPDPPKWGEPSVSGPAPVKMSQEQMKRMLDPVLRFLMRPDQVCQQLFVAIGATTRVEGLLRNSFKTSFRIPSPGMKLPGKEDAMLQAMQEAANFRKAATKAHAGDT